MSWRQAPNRHTSQFVYLKIESQSGHLLINDGNATDAEPRSFNFKSASSFCSVYWQVNIKLFKANTFAT